MLVIVNIPAKIISAANTARLTASGLPTLVLPWWPSEVEDSGLAADWAETARPGRSPLLTRASDPLPSMRLAFTLRTSTVEESVQDLVDLVKQYAAAKPVVQVTLGLSDRGHWRITEAGVVQQDWAASGEPSVAEVTMTLRAASDAAIPVGPIKKRPTP